MVVGLDAAEALIEEYGMLPADGLVLVAVSGGVDSMCLLHYIYKRGTPVAAAHFNHGLRGADADADEAFVRECCKGNNLACYTGSADVAALARARGWSVEEAGRRARYDFLERTADKLGAVRIATAHHANDNAETLLFQLLRGAKSGLGGIAPIRGRYIRPFLTVTREEIEEYARKNAIPYRTDATNADTDYTRNYIRHEIIPKFERINPNYVNRMTETALFLRRDNAYLDALAAERLTEKRGTERGVSIPCGALLRAPEALRSRVLRLLLDELPVGKKDFSSRHFAALEALAEGRGAARLDLPHGVAARRENGALTLELARCDPPPRMELAVGKTVVWGEYTICIKEAKNDELLLKGALFLRRDAARGLSVGAWDARERMTLAGRDRPRSLKRLFEERGFSPETRDFTPVLRAGGAVAAVFGIGVAAECAPGPDDEALAVEICRLRR